MKQPIRLTNKTAISLRRAAIKTRTAHYAAAVLLPVIFAALGMYMGIKWMTEESLAILFVPLSVLFAALIDWAVLIHGRSAYVSLLGQAICTEAAAREIYDGSSAKRRHEQAMRDLMNMQEDIERLEQHEEEQNQEEEDDDLYGEAPQEEKRVHRRRRPSELQLIRNQQAK